MPIILKHGHAHQFDYVDDAGNTHSVSIQRGQDIEPLNLPPRLLAKLMAETVISWNGETPLPRYAYEASVHDGPSYTSGSVSTQTQARQLNEQPGTPKKQYTADELAKIQAEAEEAATRDAQRVLDHQSAEVAEQEQVVRDEAEARELAGEPTDTVVQKAEGFTAEDLAGADRERLKEIAAQAGVDHQFNIPTEKLRELLVEKTSH